MKKKCTKCGIEKELSEFHYKKIRKYYEAQCKMCYNSGSKKYYKNNKEKVNQRNRRYYKRYYEDNKEELKQKGKQYKEDNKEKLKQQRKDNKEKTKQKDKQYYQDNKKEIAQKHKQYRKDNKEKVAQANKQYKKNNQDKQRAWNRKRRAWELKLNENFTPEQEIFVLEQFDHKCFKCGSIKKLCIDHHRALSKGNPLTLQNAVVLCDFCNCSKHNKDPEIFYGSEICEKLDKRLVIINIMYAVLKSKTTENVNSTKQEAK